MYNFVMNTPKNEEKKVELLAPAKDKECAFAAINAGADAVYIGANAFGARKKASNSLKDIYEIVEYAHKFEVKVYVTVNTILYDEELKDAEKLIWDLYAAKVDAVIFQDFGILKLNLPPIALHASTQCNNDSPEKIKFLEKCNIERVVLPREFSLDEIKYIKDNTDIELETFIHGALCVSYSGQCYFSHYIGGRSANRGECAQPCRKKYSLLDAKGNILSDSKYLLSMKDLSAESYLERLIYAGADSLKIEGRLKDKNYVKNVVAFYRKKIDEISLSLRVSKGILINDYAPNINKTFNRGYTTFNAEGSCKDLVNIQTPKFMGEYAGKIIGVEKNIITVDSKMNFSPSDGVVSFDKNGELCGSTIVSIDNNKIKLLAAVDFQKNKNLYRNFDSSFSKTLENASFIRKMPIKLKVELIHNGFKIIVNDEFKYIVTDRFEKAKNKENAVKNVISQFSKTGDTVYLVENIFIDEDFDYFIPVSRLNKIRREFMEEYDKYRIENYKVSLRDLKYEQPKYPCKNLDYSFNISNRLAEEFYKEADACVEQNAFECNNKGKILMTSKHCIRREMGICLKKKNQFSDDLFLVDEKGKKFKLIFDCKTCKMKIESL